MKSLKKEKPISVDGATLFVDSSGRTLRQFMWSFNEDSYISLNATLISSHIVQDIRSMATIRGTSTDISDFVYVVNGDGTLTSLIIQYRILFQSIPSKHRNCKSLKLKLDYIMDL